METQTHYREEVQSAEANMFQSSSSAQRAFFRKEGEYWSLGYATKAFRLKDTKGLGYLAHLLRHPATEFHVLDLVGGIAGDRGDGTIDAAQGLPHGNEDLAKAGIHIASLGDAGEMLDDQAKAAYRHRLSELREELEEAMEFSNVERAEQVEAEIDALTRELSRAVGLGGRNRKAASASERARQSTTKTIKAVVERIMQSDAALGSILTRCIRTGTFCSYQPDTSSPIAWEFAAPNAISAIEPAAVLPTSSGNGPPVRAETLADRAQAAPPVVLEVSSFSLAERTPFVDRENERRTIRTAIDRALSGHGSLIMIGGGPGVGKTRLAMEMADYAWRVGFRCAVGHCYERDEPFPFLPFAELLENNLAQATSLDNFRRHLGDNAAELAQIAPSLRRVFPDIPQPLDLPPAQRRRYLFQSISETLARSSRTRSQVRILEDLHWADESSLGLLVHLANRVAQLPVVIVATYRDGYSDNNPAFVRTLEELIRMGIRPLKLSGMSKDAVGEMLHGLSRREPPDRLVKLIFEESQGNPFFVEEVYRHLNEDGKLLDAAGEFRTDIEVDETDVPENVRLIIGRRLERLEENEKRVVITAAVIGRSFSFQLLSAICQIDVDELFTVIEKAQEMGVIIPSAEGPERPFTFAHELVRQTLLSGISTPRRQHLHAAVADAIERLSADAIEARAGDIANHLLKAGSFGDVRKLVRYLSLAGNSALKAAAFVEARQNFTSALAHQGAGDPRQRTDLLTSLAMADLGLDQLDAAIGHLREVVEIYINLDDREMVGRGFTRLTGVLIAANRFQEAIKTAHRGLGYLGTDVSAVRGRLLAALAQACIITAGYEPALDALREGFNIASQLSDRKLETRLLAVRSILNFHYFRLHETAADELRIEQLGASEASPWRQALQLRNLAQTFFYLGRREEALRIVDQLEPLAMRIGQAHEVAICVSMRAWTEFAKAPDFAKLEIGFKQSPKSDQVQWLAYWGTLSEVQLSLLDFFRGNWTSALAHAQTASSLPELEGAVTGYGAGTLFRQMAYVGDRDAALAILEQSQTRLPHIGKPNAAGSWSMLALGIEGLVTLGEHERAAQLYPLVCELLDKGAVVLWSIFRFTQMIAGLAASSARKWEAAEEHFQIAMRQAESFPNVLEQAEIRRFHAMMLLDRTAPGDRNRAQTLLNQALETYTQIGMPRHIEMARALIG
jgi:eukaryotic-like serine/threonine-protein kinase